MMTETEIEKKFNRLIATKEISDLQRNSIFETSRDIYEVFSKYKIVKKSKTEVEVVLFNDDVVHTFSSMRNAICWCIFDKRGKYNAANRIITLDQYVSSTEVSMSVHRNLFNKAKISDDRLIFLAKLNEDKLKRRAMVDELEGYVRESDYWQKNQFKLKTAH
jgi:hypothetical protein